MRAMRNVAAIWFAVVGVVSACDGSGDDAAVSSRSEVMNAPVLNAAALNGWSLNGFRTNGWSLNGWSLNGWSLNGWSLNSVQLVGSSFSGVKTVGGQAVAVSGTAMIGSQLTLQRDGVAYTLRFDNIYKDPAKPAGDVYFHKVSVLDPGTGTWSSLCRDAHGQPTEAIALANHWNPTTGARVNDAAAVTLACRDAVLAKCVEWGYRPWASATRCVGGTCTQVSLAEYHQACTRMARADYCGNGTPHTLNGTPIDVYDRLSAAVQSESTKGLSNWSIEAEWGPNGAVCVGDELRLKMFDDLGISYDYPECLDAIDDFSDCGSFRASRGAKVANRYCSEWTDDPAECDE